MSEKSMQDTAHKQAVPAPEAMAAVDYAERAVRKHEQAMHGANAPETAAVAAGGKHHHGAPSQPEPAQNLVNTEARSLLPSVSSIVQAGAFGAALGGMTTGVMEMARVKHGEITTDEAVRNVVKSSAQGAATMAVASVASQVVRSHPVFGFIALAAAGIGAFVILSGTNPKTASNPASSAGTLPAKPATGPKKPA